MPFELNEEQQLIQQTTRQFALETIQPVAATWEERGEYPEEIVQKAVAVGLVGAQIPRKY